MKWLKKWYYLLLFLCTGIVYLSCVDRWQVYAGPAEAVRGWYDTLAAKDRGEISGEQSGGEPAGENQAPEGGEVKPGTDNTDGSSEPPSGGTQPGDTLAGGDAQGAGGEQSDGEPSAGQEASMNNAPSYITVEDDYFADAVFIGDSRTVGMFEYGGLEEISTFYASTGLTVYKMFTSEIVSVPGQKKKITVEEALQESSFAKIYLMIGINEMGTGNVDTFMEKYAEVVAHLQELQPQAIIYLQGIMKVTTERSGQGDYINNEGIIERNERIAQLADNERIFYLDVNPLICDEDGGMEASYTFDGVHLKAKYIDIWKQFLKEHAIEAKKKQ